MGRIGRGTAGLGLWLLWVVALGLTRSAAAQVQTGFGGALLPRAVGGDCISSAERARAEWNIALFHARFGPGDVQIQAEPGGPLLYAFHPQAGNLWDELFITNFVDLDKGSGIRDWECTDWTYDGHQGIDIGLRSFGEQDIGVPVFAALDGTVVDAHDGEFDKQTAWTGAPANYVILYHGGSHYTWYWHLKKGSVAVVVSQTVKAGTQLGLTGSSGQSTGPHLHFESRNAGTWYEPYGGPCSGNQSFWAHQMPIRREMYLRDYLLTDVNPPDYAVFPYRLPGRGAFVMGSRSVAFWMLVANLPAASTWQYRFIRPDGSVALDSGVGAFGNLTSYRLSLWWRRWSGINLDVPGTWRVELRINGQRVVQAPLDVVATPGQVANRPPEAVTGAFDPPRPLDGDVLFCRLGSTLGPDDADYDIVRYRYQWSINGQPARDVTTAGRSDALASGLARASDLVECTVTPTDGQAAGPPITLRATVGFTLSGSVTENGAGVSGVTVSAGARSAVTGRDGTYLISGLPAGSHTVTPSRSGYTFTPANRAVKLGPDAGGIDFRAAVISDGVQSLTLTPASVLGPASAVGIVTLDTPAPAGGAEVALSSDRPAIAAVPASVTVAAGATTATFPVTTVAVSSATPVIITASRNGVTRSVTFTVSAAGLTSLALIPTSAVGGTVVVGAVTLGEPAPAGGVVVTLASENPQVAAVPSTVTVPADVLNAFFLVTTSPVATATPVTLTATVGSVQQRAVLQVLAGQ